MNVLALKEMEFKGMEVHPGSLLKIRREKEAYAFVSLIFYTQSEETKVLCQSAKGRYKLFDLNEIIKVITKRSFNHERHGKKTAD